MQRLKDLRHRLAHLPVEPADHHASGHGTCGSALMSDMGRNSRVALQAWVLELAPPGQPVHVVDAGANVGDWSWSFLNLARLGGRLDDVDLHAFEPCAETFRRLEEQLGDSAAALHQVALSDQAGETILHIAAHSTLNTMCDIPGAHTAAETVAATTVDAYARQANLDQIHLLCVDTVGHEMAVLKGASDLLREHRIAVITFLHNDFWIYAGNVLCDAFRLLEPLGYRIGRLTTGGVEFYPAWSPELELFRDRMYVACPTDVAGRLPQVDPPVGPRR